jgi:DNA polymerase sigma
MLTKLCQFNLIIKKYFTERDMQDIAVETFVICDIFLLIIYFIDVYFIQIFFN